MRFKNYLKEDAVLKELRPKIIDYFTKTKNPDDTDIHKLAETLGVDKHEFEEEIYALLSDFFSCGKYIKEGGNIDKLELSKGIKVEMEHTCCKLIAEKIAKDHLSEIPDYYTRLDKMEKEAKK